MSTQYDAIQAPYDEMRKASIALIERANVKTAIDPYIHDARVLELACGSGYYSYNLLEWGASKVVGVDISPAMLQEARNQRSLHTALGKSHSIAFIAADCSKPLQYEGGPFDIVFGAWFLNYAANEKELVEMFRNISMNLKPGGCFLGVVPPPTEDPAGFIHAETKLRPPPIGSGLLWESVTAEFEDGVAFHAHGDTSCGMVDFDCYHLKKHVYENAAKEAGMTGEVKWYVTDVPDGFLLHRNGGATLNELESYKVVPNYGLLVVGK